MQQAGVDADFPRGEAPTDRARARRIAVELGWCPFAAAAS
jgi:hypothetical protein